MFLSVIFCQLGWCCFDPHHSTKSPGSRKRARRFSDFLKQLIHCVHMHAQMPTPGAEQQQQVPGRQQRGRHLMVVRCKQRENCTSRVQQAERGGGRGGRERRGSADMYEVQTGQFLIAGCKERGGVIIPPEFESPHRHDRSQKRALFLGFLFVIEVCRELRRLLLLGLLHLIRCYHFLPPRGLRGGNALRLHALLRFSQHSVLLLNSSIRQFGHN